MLTMTRSSLANSPMCQSPYKHFPLVGDLNDANVRLSRNAIIRKMKFIVEADWWRTDNRYAYTRKLPSVGLGRGSSATRKETVRYKERLRGLWACATASQGCVALRKICDRIDDAFHGVKYRMITVLRFAGGSTRSLWLGVLENGRRLTSS